MKRFGELLRELREERGLKQNDLAKLAGFGDHNGPVSIIETAREPKFSVACNLIYALQMTPNEFAARLDLKVWNKKYQPKGVKQVVPADG